MEGLSISTHSRILEYSERWGNHTTLALLESPCTFFFHPNLEGVIGYREKAASLAVLGDPLCAPHDRQAFIDYFHAFVKKEGKSVTYFNTSDAFAHWFHELYGGPRIGIGNEIILNPQRDYTKETGVHASQLRQKERKSRKEDLEFYEYSEHDPVLEEELEKVGELWLKNRRGPQISLFPLNVFTIRAHKRWFYVKQRTTIVGLLILRRVHAQHGWVLNASLCQPESPTVTSAFMVLSLLKQLRQEGCSYLSVGTLPDYTPCSFQSMGFFEKKFIQASFGIGNRLFKIKNLKRYWNQFDPQIAPTYMLSPSPIGLRKALAVLHALNVNF